VPITDAFKRVLPKVGATKAASDGPANIQTAFEGFSNSLHAVVPATSETERNQIRAAVPAAGFPLFVYDDEDAMLYVSQTRTSDWIPIGGKPVGARVNLNTQQVGAGTRSRIKFTTFAKKSSGWTLSNDGYQLICPAAGMYHVWSHVAFTAQISNLDRVMAEIVVNGAVASRESAWDETDLNCQGLLEIPKNAAIEFWVYSQGGGVYNVRAGELVAVRQSTPNW